MTRETTTEEMDFIRAILAKPDDDAIRLIFADYLDEQGDSDAATNIRNQCRRYEDCKRYYSDAAIINWQDVDTTALEEKVSAQAKDWRKGFVEYMSCPGDYWCDISHEMLKYHPLREVTITDHVQVEAEVQEDGSFYAFINFQIKAVQLWFNDYRNGIRSMVLENNTLEIRHSFWNDVCVKIPYFRMTHSVLPSFRSMHIVLT